MPCAEKILETQEIESARRSILSIFLNRMRRKQLHIDLRDKRRDGVSHAVTEEGMFQAVTTGKGRPHIPGLF